MVGDPGTGKTVFGLQFLVSGLMDKEKGLYVIDPVGPLLFGRESASPVLDQARMLFYGLQANTNTTHLLTTYSAGHSVRSIEEYLVSGTFVLEMELSNSRFIRTLTIEKMRSTALAPAQYVLNIMQDSGIVLRNSLELARQSPPSESASDDR